MRRGIHSPLEIMVRHFAETLQSVSGILATCVSNEGVVVLLTKSYVADGDGRSGQHEGSAEQALRVAAVGKHLQPN